MEKRFGIVPQRTITEAVRGSVPINTRKTKISIWKQFQAFCAEKTHKLSESSSLEEIAYVLEDWAFNMKKGNGDDYKECVVKTMWNVTAKMVQEMYYKNYKRVFDPFTDIIFKAARDARNAKRKQLRTYPEKRKATSLVLTSEEYNSMVKIWDEETPLGLQRKFFHIASRELAWRSSNEAATCLVQHFRKEVAPSGLLTGRIEYNRAFSAFEDPSNKSESRFLTPNLLNQDFCPVRLFNKLIEKRNERIRTDRLFLTVNPFWPDGMSSGWYKNMPVGKNEVAKWTKCSAEMIGLDAKRLKMLSFSRGPKFQVESISLSEEHQQFQIQFNEDCSGDSREEDQAYSETGTKIKSESDDHFDYTEHNIAFDDPLVESTTVGDSLRVALSPSLESNLTQPASSAESISHSEGMKKEHINETNIVVSKLDKLENLLAREKSETEFDIFGKSIAMQLNKMPLNEGLQLQLKIQQVITEFRLTKCATRQQMK